RRRRPGYWAWVSLRCAAVVMRCCVGRTRNSAACRSDTAHWAARNAASAGVVRGRPGSSSSPRMRRDTLLDHAVNGPHLAQVVERDVDELVTETHDAGHLKAADPVDPCIPDTLVDRAPCPGER